MRKKKINIPIYFGDLLLYQCKNWKKLNKKYKMKAPNSYEAFVFSETKSNGRLEYIACFSKNPSVSLIAHEAVHLVNLIFKDRSINLDLENDESQAYLTGWLVNEMTKFLK